MDFKGMTDSELANMMVIHIGRVEHLQHLIRRYIEGNDSISSSQIRDEYARLKEGLRDDARYLSLKRNLEVGTLYKGDFEQSIRETTAFGFTFSIEATVNKLMFNAVAEVHYNLTKYYSLEDGGALI